MLSKVQWANYRRIINKASESFNKDIILWKRFTRSFNRYSEDNQSNNTYEDINLDCLIAYNIFRTWPMTDETVSGALDKESIVLILNKDYLRKLGYISDKGFFDMDPGNDIFILRGLEYRASGETEVAQAGDDPLMFYIVLSREETETGKDQY